MPHGTNKKECHNFKNPKQCPSKAENAIRKHRRNNTKNMPLAMMLILPRTRDGAIPVESHRDAELGTQIIKKVFSIFGLTMRAGTGNES